MVVYLFEKGREHEVYYENMTAEELANLRNLISAGRTGTRVLEVVSA